MPSQTGFKIGDCFMCKDEEYTMFFRIKKIRGGKNPLLSMDEVCVTRYSINFRPTMYGLPAIDRWTPIPRETFEKAYKIFNITQKTLSKL